MEVEEIYHADTKMKDRDTIKIKEEATRVWIDKYNASDDQTKMMLKDGIVKRITMLIDGAEL